MHVVPSEGLHERVVGEDSHVLGKVRVINAHCREPEGFGCGQCAKSRWAWRADDNFRESTPFEMVENLKRRREAQALELVFGKLKFPDGFEVFDRNALIRHLRPAGHNRDVTACRDACGCHFADRCGDAIHILQRVCEPSPAGVL